jgi:hypothetical protein
MTWRTKPGSHWIQASHVVDGFSELASWTMRVYGPSVNPAFLKQYNLIRWLASKPSGCHWQARVVTPT